VSEGHRVASSSHGESHEEKGGKQQHLRKLEIVVEMRGDEKCSDFAFSI